MAKTFKTAMLAVGLAVTGLLASSSSTWALGPNMMCNSGFEGGNQGGYINLGSTFNVFNDASAYAGSWDVKANLTGGFSNFYQPVPVWTNTNYTSSIRYKGTGTIAFQIIKGDWSGTIATTTVTGTGSWQQVTLSYNTGSQSTVYVQCMDDAAGTMYLDNMFTGLNAATDINFNPSNPSASGLSNTLLNNAFTSTSGIDLSNTQNNGYTWYLAPWAGFGTTTSSDLSIVSNALSMNNGALIHTAIPGQSSTGWMGTGWQAGSGIYFEANIAIQNPGNINGTAWPSFWLQDLTNDTGVGNAMPGNSGHTEGVENDIMEYNPSAGFWGSNDYASTLHDWVDGSGANLVNGNNDIVSPTVGTDYSQYHKYGMLWVPATAANSYYGYRQAFFDGQPMAAVNWVGNQNYLAGIFPPTSASMGSYVFSDMDRHPLDLIIGAGPGAAPTISIQYVHVYAASTSSKDVVTGTKYTTPAAPTGLTATASTGHVALSWTAVSGATQYYIFRSTSSGSEGYITAVSSTSYTDSDVTNGTRYYYTVAATNPAGTSGWSNEASAIPGGGGSSAPPVPTGLTATASSNQVALSWTASSGATQYYVFRSTSSGTEVNIATAASTSYTDTGVTAGTKYYYTVAANNSFGTSSWSNEVNATPTAGAPPVPTGLTATAGSGNVALAWNASSGATLYYVFRSTSSGTEVRIANVTSNSYNDMTVTNGTKYYYTVAANNSFGTSNWSNEVNATPTGSHGPNLILNPGFESGSSSWNDQSAFSQVNNATNAHAGSYETVATLASGAGYTNFFQGNIPVAASTNYTASIWVKGSGKLQFEVISGNWSTILVSTNIAATSTWQQVTLPVFNSGTNTTVIFLVTDSVGGTAGTVYLDDCFLGT